MINFTIFGQPQGKARARVTRWGTYTPEKTVLYESLIKQICQTECQQMLEGELSMVIEAYYEIPKSTSKKKAADMIFEVIRPTKKPDADNIAKVVCDALNKIAYQDDTQIVDLTVRKFYSVRPRVEVKLETLKLSAQA